jgi:hypothetical protein
MDTSIIVTVRFTLAGFSNRYQIFVDQVQLTRYYLLEFPQPLQRPLYRLP